MNINLDKNQTHFLLYTLNKSVEMYEQEGKYGSANVIKDFIKTIKEQTNIK